MMVTTTEDASYYCYTAPLHLFSQEEVRILKDSLPSERESKVPGCRSAYENDSMYDPSVWNHVKNDDVPDLENVGKVVLAYAYE